MTPKNPPTNFGDQVRAGLRPLPGRTVTQEAQPAVKSATLPGVKSINPLENAIVTIEENRNYLNEDLMNRLLTLAFKGRELDISVKALVDNRKKMKPEHFNALRELLPVVIEETTDLSLEGMLARFSRLVRQMEVANTNGEGGDIKSTISAAKDLFNLVAKHGQSIEAEKKLNILKSTISEVLDGMSPEDGEKFTELWEAKVREAIQKTEGAR